MMDNLHILLASILLVCAMMIVDGVFKSRYYHILMLLAGAAIYVALSLVGGTIRL